MVLEKEHRENIKHFSNVQLFNVAILVVGCIILENTDISELYKGSLQKINSTPQIHYSKHYILYS
jgi:hypothetical protein